MQLFVNSLAKLAENWCLWSLYFICFSGLFSWDLACWKALNEPHAYMLVTSECLNHYKCCHTDVVALVSSKNHLMFYLINLPICRYQFKLNMIEYAAYVFPSHSSLNVKFNVSGIYVCDQCQWPLNISCKCKHTLLKEILGMYLALFKPNGKHVKAEYGIMFESYLFSDIAYTDKFPANL